MYVLNQIPSLGNDGVIPLFTDVCHERASLCNAPPHYSEPVSMPEFGESFLQQGKDTIYRSYLPL